MPPAKRERPPVPPKELLFVYPPDVPGPEPVDAAIIRELPPHEARWISKVLRVLHVWTRPYPGAGAFDYDELQELALELAAAAYERRDEDLDELLVTPLALILWRLMEYEEVDSETVAMDCLNVASWAAKHGYVATRLAFGELAAYAVWDHPGWSWVAGRHFRMAGRDREAEQWYRRAARLARWKKDWDVMALSLNSLGNIYYECGNYGRAERTLQRALRVARRHVLKEREGEILHDLFAVTMVSDRRQDAEHHAQAALRAYLPDHPRLHALAYDVAYFWVLNGYFSRALTVLRDLHGRFETTEQNLFVAVATARAAAATGQRDVYERQWREAESLIPYVQSDQRLAVALVDLGISAASARDWEKASDWIARGGAVAADVGAADVVARAEAVLSKVRCHAPPEVERRPAGLSAANTVGERLAGELVLTLGK